MVEANKNHPNINKHTTPIDARLQVQKQDFYGGS